MMGIHKIATSCAKAKFKSNQMNKSAVDLGASALKYLRRTADEANCGLKMAKLRAEDANSKCGLAGWETPYQRLLHLGQHSTSTPWLGKLGRWIENQID
jgi:hypothetical protein